MVLGVDPDDRLFGVLPWGGGERAALLAISSCCVLRCQYATFRELVRIVCLL